MNTFDDMIISIENNRKSFDDTLEELREIAIERRENPLDYDEQTTDLLFDVYHSIKSFEADADALEELVVWGFYEDDYPRFAQGNAGIHELSSPVTAEECKGYIDTIKEKDALISELSEVLFKYLVLGAGKCTIGRPLADMALAVINKAAKNEEG